MSYPPNGFNWNWSDLPATASLADVISTVNWIGYNLDSTFTPWAESNFNDMYTHVDNAETLAQNASTAAAAIQTVVDAITGQINRCSYLRGTH